MSDIARTLGERIRKVRGEMSQAAFAAKIGINKNLLGKYERGESIPGGEILAQMRDALGISVDWLLTGWMPPPHWDDDEKYIAGIEAARAAAGQAEASPSAVTAAPTERDPDLYGRVLEAISAVYKEMNWGISLRQLGAEAAQIADDISAEGLAPDEKPPAVKAAAAMLRRKLRDAATDPTAEASTKGRA